MNQELQIGTKQLAPEEILKLVRQWGYVASDGLLEKNCQIFSIPEVEGFIGYKFELLNAVVIGDPVCAPKDKPVLALAFDEECRKKNLGVVYTIVSQEFAEWANQHLSAVVIEYGKILVLDPQYNPSRNTGSKAVLVRKKVKHARNEGAVVKEYLGNDPKIEKQLEDVATEWLQKRKGPQIYLCHLALFENRYGKRWFYAQKGTRIVALLILNELQTEKGWVLNNVMMVKDAPKGISEFLVVSILDVLNQERCRFVMAGPVPSKSLGKIMGIGEIKSAIIRFIFRMSRHVFHLDGLSVFWEKFQAQEKGSYLLFPHHNLRLSSIKALMQALNAEKG